MAKEKRTKSEVFGDTMLDVGKLIFAGVVLAGIFDSSINKGILILAGFVISVAAVWMGIMFITKK